MFRSRLKMVSKLKKKKVLPLVQDNKVRETLCRKNKQ